MPKNVMDPASDAPGRQRRRVGDRRVASRAPGRSRPRRRGRPSIFAAVAGEEQGLVGAELLAKKLLAEEKQVVFMITNDIVGGATGSNGRREPNILRCFSEGVPSTPEGREPAGADGRRQRQRRAVAPGRALPRRAGPALPAGLRGPARLPPGPLPPRRRPQAVQRARPSRDPAHGAQRELRLAARERPRGGRPQVRRPVRERGPRLRPLGRPGERRGDPRGRARARLAPAGAHGRDEAHAPHDAPVGEEPRARPRRLRRRSTA